MRKHFFLVLCLALMLCVQACTQITPTSPITIRNDNTNTITIGGGTSGATPTPTPSGGGSPTCTDATFTATVSLNDQAVYHVSVSGTASFLLFNGDKPVKDSTGATVTVPHTPTPMTFAPGDYVIYGANEVCQTNHVAIHIN